VIIAIVTNYLFIPKYGIEGAALATLISLVLFNSLKFLFIWIKFGLQPFSTKWLAVLGLAGVSYLAVSAIPFVQHWTLDIAVRGLVITALFLVPVLWFNLSPDINDVVRKIWKRIA